MKQYKNSCCCQPTLRSFFVLSGFLISLLLSYKGYCQFPTVAVYDFPNDLKHYSTEMATDGTSVEETVMAGTIYNFNSTGNHVAHFMNVSPNGTINSSAYFQDPKYADLRVVDIVGDGNSSNAIYYITCLARPSSGGNDRILVIPVDINGTQTGNAYSIFPSSGTEGLYPLHSIYHSNGYLYICGYWTDNNTNLSNGSEPDFNGYNHKDGFILKLNPSTGAVQNSSTARLINTTYQYTASNPTEDYDIAMRLVEMGNGHIFVTGSVNDVKYNVTTSAEMFHSAVMNVVFDQNLSTPAAADYDHFTYNTSNGPYFGNDYGVGLVEDGANSSNYIVANTFDRNGSASGFDISGGHVNITWLDANLDHTNTGLTRLLFEGYDYAWGLQTLEACGSSGFANGRRFLIPGMETNEWCGSSFSFDDVRPFLWDVDVRLNGGTGDIDFVNYNWTTYHTQTGTGSYSSATNSYPNLDNSLSNMAWNPTFAARLSTSYDIMMSAPRWDNANNDLNLKYIRADLCDLNSACYNSYTSETNADPCNQGLITKYQAEGLGHTNGSGNIVYTNFPTTSCSTTTTPVSGAGKMITGTYSGTSDFCTPSNNVYKPGKTSINRVNTRGNSTSIFPNPTNNDIHVRLDKNISSDSKVVVQLFNIYGQNIADLYNGSADALNPDKKLQLPDVASGLYLVHITVNGQTLLQQKLIKQ